MRRYEGLGWLMYVLGAVVAIAFWFYLDGLPASRTPTPYAFIGLPAIPFVVLGKYFMDKDRKASK